ncbi:MAG TPA: adenylate/guanylate cyclase domain-containing protein [Burkholderiales bacterium]|nr:adenylate/guanylate cyclase domain-containing protein [Burkholderiales bacterium]
MRENGGSKIAETSARRAILFADVCDSTSIYESIGDARALGAINRLFGVLTKKVKAAKGTVIKTMGDGMVCQFATPDAALRAACEMQEATTALTSPTLRRELSIRIGFNYGPVVPKGGDVFGDTVNVCSRLVGLANPRQVLTTQQTVDALSPGLRKRCRTLQPTKVRGRAAEVAACEVLWRGDADITALNLTKDTVAKASQWVLKLSYGEETYTIDSAASVRIGRDKENDVVVPTQHASRLHARVIGRDGHFVIVDQSSNGTFVMVDGSTREIRLRREEAVLGERGIIGLGSPTASSGDHMLHYQVQRRGG